MMRTRFRRLALCGSAALIASGTIAVSAKAGFSIKKPESAAASQNSVPASATAPTPISAPVAVPLPVGAPADAVAAPAVATAPALAASADQAGAYLDHIAGTTFRSPLGRAKVTVNENGEWRLQTPSGAVHYVTRDPAGGFSFWITSPLGMRFAATGKIGSRGLAICWKSGCQYWLTVADGTSFIVGANKKGDGSIDFAELHIMVKDGTPAAAALAKQWETRDSDPAYLIYRKKVTVDQVLGFPLATIDSWITAGAAPAPLAPVTIAAAPPAAQVAQPAPVAVRAAPPPASSAAAAIYTRRTTATTKKRGGGFWDGLNKVLFGDGSTPYVPVENPLFPSGTSGSGWSPQAQEEVERWKVREQLYGSSGSSSPSSSSSSSSQPYAKAYDQLARDRAAGDARRAEVRAQIDASRAEEARAFAASPAANQPGTAASGTRPVTSAARPAPSTASSSGNGLIVKPVNDDWERGEAQRLATNASERAAQERRERAEADRVATEKAIHEQWERDMAERTRERDARLAACRAGNCPPARATQQ